MRGGSAGNLLRSSKSRLKWAIALEWNHRGLAAAYEWRVIPLLLFVSSRPPEAYTRPGIFWKEMLYFCNTLTFSLWALVASRWCKLSFHKAIWATGDLRFCCYGNSSVPLISYYFCEGECVVPAVSDPQNTPHTPSRRPGSCQMGLTPSLLLFLGCSLAFFFAFAWSHFKLPPSDFLATVRWPLQPSSWHLSATNLNLAAERRVLKEPEGNSRWPWGMYTQFLQCELIIASELCIWTDLSVWESLFFLPSALPPFVELYRLHTMFTAGWLSADIQIRAGYRRRHQRSSIDNPANACAEARLSRSACFSACLRVNSSSDGPVSRSCVNLHCSHAACVSCQRGMCAHTPLRRGVDVQSVAACLTSQPPQSHIVYSTGQSHIPAEPWGSR